MIDLFHYRSSAGMRMQVQAHECNLHLDVAYTCKNYYDRLIICGSATWPFWALCPL
jgi:hypothetical protein